MSGGRPMGEVAARVHSLVQSSGALLMRDIARELQISTRDTSQALRSLQRAQRVVPLGVVRVPHAKRPLAKYGLPEWS